MKRTSIFLGALVMILAAAGCNSSAFKKTKSGLMYKIISDGKGATAKRGDIIKLHFVQKLRDSVLGSSYGQMPFYSPIDSVGATYDPKEIFPLLRKGDSAIVIIEADSIFKKQGNLPPFIKRTDKLTLTLRVADLFTSDSLAQADQMVESGKMQQKQMAEAETQKTTKVKELEEYLAKNKITAQKTPGGTYVVVTDPGTGAQVDSGKLASVRYTGKLFPDGKVFESNMEPGKEAYKVLVGTHGVISGWDEGLKYFKAGGKGTLYIPFFQAYGAQQGPGGKPFENLIFDIQIDSVGEAPKQPEANMPPPPPAKPKSKSK